MSRQVIIDCSAESVERYRHGYAIVAVDVIRTTTTIATAVSLGRRCYPAASLEAAQVLRAQHPDSLCAGEQSGEMPAGFDLNNSPAEVALRTDTFRSLILLSSHGTKLIHAARNCGAVYVACLRNARFLSRYLAGLHSCVAVIGAGNYGEFREEDQICCAWIAGELLRSGFQPQDLNTNEMIARWEGKPISSILCSKSVQYLRRTGQARDLAFILSHVADLEEVFQFDGEEVVMIAGDSQITSRISAHSGAVLENRMEILD